MSGWPDLEQAALEQLLALETRRPGFFAAMVARYQEGGLGQLSALSEALDSGELNSIGNLTHRMRGDSLYLGAKKVAAHAREIAQHAQAGDLAEAKRWLSLLQRAFSAALEQLAAFSASVIQNAESNSTDKGQD